MTGFIERHIGVSEAEIQHMLAVVGVSSLDELIEKTVPENIRLKGALNIPSAKSESEALESLQTMANKNEVWRSFLGMGYYRTHTPTVILRNLIENPSWYTSYTPYQAEISQGRLESLLIFQTMVQDLTALPLANSSLLDEATAAAEAMAMVLRAKSSKRRKDNAASKIFFISELCHPNTIAVVQGRAVPLDVQVVVGDHRTFEVTEQCIGVLLQYPATDGQVLDYSHFISQVKSVGAYTVMASDLMALTLLKAPGELGADIVVGNSQRFGVPMGFGGPHAAFLACTEEHKKNLPGRIIGVTVDADGNKALRMALQTREQHIRREKATSNVCTAQALLANVAAMFAVYHGPKRLKAMAEKMHLQACAFAKGLQSIGLETTTSFFDTVAVECGENLSVYSTAAKEKKINLRQEGTQLIVAFDECMTSQDIDDLASIFAIDFKETPSTISEDLQRQSSFLTDSCFNSYHSETDMLRYLHKLAKRDLALDTAMIPLGSCTMKLNATTEMMPITWTAFNGLHPHIPEEQYQGYQDLFADLENWLADITGFDAISLQPNAGSQGEYAGLLAIRGYHHSRGDLDRNICLIPTSAHGTNPASAVMAGMTVVKVKCDDQGNIDVEDLRAQAIAHSDKLAALMVTYPSTHGVFEESIMDICAIVHEHGGQVYMDGANMNAMVGISRPGDIGADVCHLNLHKTFCIPHGGGGPGVGPIGVKSQLQPFLPQDPRKGQTAVSGALYGSASILPIPWAYIAMTGAEGLKKCSQVAILSANYLAKRLEEAFPVLYKGSNGFCAHECILDTRIFKSSGIEVTDIAKRLMDYGFHAPTMSWPVTGTLMVEPTESEPLKELDRFVEAMLMIRAEIQQVMDGVWAVEESPLRQAPHTQSVLMQMDWSLPYSREVAAFPTNHTKDNKYWPLVRRVNDVFGDRRLVCSCAAWLDDEA